MMPLRDLNLAGLVRVTGTEYFSSADQLDVEQSRSIVRAWKLS